jgi:antirestriction protein ArdC
MNVAQRSRLDIHQTVTDKIIAAIEAGVDEWQMPWHRPGTSFAIPKNALTEKYYRGINILSLWIDADDKKFEHQLWSTYKQWSELGAQVRAGEKATLIVKYGTWSPKDAEADDNGDTPTRMYARPAWVFNVAQVDGFPAPSATPLVDLTTRLEHVDHFLANTKAEFRYGGQRAFYRRRSSDGSGDYIQIPERRMFTGTATSSATEAFEGTRIHEILHWTSDSRRLDRELGKRFGDAAYSFEEIVAEIGAAAMCAHLELASKAIDYLYSLQPTLEGDAP